MREVHEVRARLPRESPHALCRQSLEMPCGRLGALEAHPGAESDAEQVRALNNSEGEGHVQDLPIGVPLHLRGAKAEHLRRADKGTALTR